MPKVDTYVYRWEVERGQRDALILTVYDSDSNPVNVDGWQVDVIVREFNSHLAPVAYTFPPELLSATPEGVSVTLPVPVIAGWEWQFAWFEVYVTDPSGTETDPLTSRVAEGWITLS